ncbi:Hypothetical predicted protein, partial [Mytilus galloprovincialis]
MSTTRVKTPNSLQHIEEGNTFIIYQKGEYKFSMCINGEVTVTSIQKDLDESKKVNILDNEGNILLECSRYKRSCFRHIFQIDSPHGFTLGFVRK